MTEKEKWNYYNMAVPMYLIGKRLKEDLNSEQLDENKRLIISGILENNK